MNISGLIVENVEADREYLHDLVESEIGVRCLWAKDGDTARGIVNSGDNDFILLDMYVDKDKRNKENKRAMLNRIRGVALNKRIPVIVVTAYRDEFRDLEVDEFVPLAIIAKPEGGFANGGPVARLEREAFDDRVKQAVWCAVFVRGLLRKIENLKRDCDALAKRVDKHNTSAISARRAGGGASASLSGRIVGSIVRVLESRLIPDWLKCLIVLAVGAGVVIVSLYGR